jgi:hypothetical protein
MKYLKIVLFVLLTVISIGYSKKARALCDPSTLFCTTVSISNNSYTFSGTLGKPGPATQPITIFNAGNATASLKWQALHSKPWCYAQPDNNYTNDGRPVASIPPGGSQTVNIAVADPSVVGSSGVFTCTITIDDTSQISTTPPQTVNVTYNIGSAANANINLSKNNLSFVGISSLSAPANQTVSLTNYGTPTLNWSASVNQTWCHVGPSSGNLGSGANANLSVSVDPPSNVGNFTCNVTVSDPNAENSPQNIAVNYNVTPQGHIVLAPSALGFSGVIGNPATPAQTLVLTNTGSSLMNWSISANQSWCSVSPNSGSVNTGASANLLVSVSSPSNVGNFNCTLTVNAPVADNNFATVNVSYVVTATAQGHLTLTPNADANFANWGQIWPANNPTVSPVLSPAHSITLSNTGITLLNWNASTDQSWCVLDTVSGNLNAGQSIGLNVSVTVNPSPNNTNCNITISSASANNSPQIIPVHFWSFVFYPSCPFLCNPADMNLSKSALNFTATTGGSAPAVQSVTITNAIRVGSANNSWATRWVAYPDQPWCHAVAPGAGVITPGSSADMQIYVDAPSSLGSGNFSCDVTFFDPTAWNGPQTVTVNYSVSGSGAPPPPPSTYSRTISFSLEGRTTKVISGTVDVLSGSSLVKSYPFTSDSSGSSNITFDVATGTYTLRIKATPFLSKVLTVDLNSTSTYSFPQLLTGDINQDGIVNSIDYSSLNAKWFTNDTTADLNQDGLVNSLDYSLLNKNWFVQGQ